MSFEKNISNYNQYNRVEANSDSEIVGLTDGLLNTEILERASEADYYNMDKVALNTLSFADLFTSAKINNSTTYPEVALMLIKTYMLKLFADKGTIAIEPSILYKVMNNNQELIELPYAFVLYLGALYHYKVYNSGADINAQTIDSVFNRTNKISLANIDPLDPQNSKNRDIYQTQELYRSPSRIRIEHTPDGFLNRKVYFPSVRVLNRSVYTGATTYKSSNFKFQYVSGLSGNDEIISDGSVDSLNIMPAVGYGIQNNFLNLYNEFMFGDYLNGSYNKTADDGVYNDGLPQVLIGGYCGISKPIKTYDSGLLEFTALYRNAWVGNFTSSDGGFGLTDIVNEFKTGLGKLKNITPGSDLDKDKKEGLIRSFIALSRVKALFLSDQITTQDDLYQYILVMSETNTLTGTQPDLYYLMVNYFFANESEINTILITPANQAISNESDPKISISGYITQYLFTVWSREYFNLLSKYSQVNSKAVYGLYPSAGGFLNPHGLFVNADNSKLNVGIDNGVVYDTNNIFAKPTELLDNKHYYRKVFDEVYKSEKFGKEKVDAYTIISDKMYNLFKERGFEITTEKTTPTKPKYFLNKDLDNDMFLKDYCFNNHAILKNTTRFLWFDTTNFATNLKCDIATDYYVELTSGFEKMINDRTYFTHNHFINYDYQTYANQFFGTGATWSEQFNLSHLMDSLDFEKLEEFRELFLNFATPDTTLKGNEGFNVKTLMRASTMITFDDIEDYTDESGIVLSTTDINVALIGNSMYNYDFLAKSGLNKFMNGALTKAQKKRVNEVISSFCTQKTTIANFSPMGSINYGSAPQFAAHLFPFLPDIMFSDVKDYDGLLVKLKPTPYNISEKDVTRYLSRKILFGDAYVPANNVENNETTNRIQDFNNLNSLYLINHMYTQKNIETTVDDEGRSLPVGDLYAAIVRNYFNELNIDFDRNIYKQHIKLIRSYVFDTFRQLGILNEKVMPNMPMMSYDEFTKYFNVPPVVVKTDGELIREGLIETGQSVTASKVNKETGILFGRDGGGLL